MVKNLKILKKSLKFLKNLRFICMSRYLFVCQVKKYNLARSL